MPLEQNVIIGQMLATPRQAWYFRHRHHWEKQSYWNISCLLEMLKPLEPARVRLVVQKLLEHHDALRIRIREIQSEYYYFFSPPDENIPFSFINLSRVPEENQPRAIERIATKYQASLDLLNGPALRIVLFELGPHKTQRLLFIVSHTVCDGFSFQILIDDFVTLYDRISQGLPMRLLPKTTSFKTWGENRWQYSKSESFLQELKYWQSLPWNQLHPLPVDYPERLQDNIKESFRTVRSNLSIQETGILIREVTKFYKVNVEVLLLTAMVQTFKKWTGSYVLAPLMTHHGRITPFLKEDLSCTVGNIHSAPKVVLELKEETDVQNALASIKEQLHRIPNHGIMWDWLPMEMTRESNVSFNLSFNYLGRGGYSDSKRSKSWFRQAPESTGPNEDPKSNHWVLIGCTAFIERETLCITWAYSENIYFFETIEYLAHEYIQTLRHFIPDRIRDSGH